MPNEAIEHEESRVTDYLKLLGDYLESLISKTEWGPSFDKLIEELRQLAAEAHADSNPAGNITNFHTVVRQYSRTGREGATAAYKEILAGLDEVLQASADIVSAADNARLPTEETRPNEFAAARRALHDGCYRLILAFMTVKEGLHTLRFAL